MPAPLPPKILLLHGRAVAVAENAAVQLAKLGGLLGLSPVAERILGSFTPSDDGDNPFAG